MSSRLLGRTLIVILVGVTVGWAKGPWEEKPPATSQEREIKTNLRIGDVVVCSSVQGWKNYTQKDELLPGEAFRVYAEAFGFSKDKILDLVYDYRIIAPSGAVIATRTVNVSRDIHSTSFRWAAYPTLVIPPDAPPGPYTARVDIRDNLTSLSRSKSVAFTVMPPDALQLGRAMLVQRRYKEALKSFKKAQKLHGKKSADLHFGMALAYKGLGAYKNALKESDKALQYASDEYLLAQAHNLKGIFINALAKRKDKKKFQEAEREFRAALELSENIPNYHFNLGVTLLRQERDSEGIQELEVYLELDPEGSDVKTANRYIDNPRRARENFAPEFSLVSLDGEYFDLEELQGRVLVLDFWETWCRPCIAALPFLRKLHKKYSDDQVVLLSISSDADADSLEEFLEKHKMVWAQYLDRKREFRRLFQVNVFPTYLVIDGEGIIRRRIEGLSLGKAGALQGEIKKHLKTLPKFAGKELP